MKKIIIIVVVIFIIAVLFLIGRSLLSNNSFNLTPQAKAIINNSSFNLLLAKTPKEKEVGLSNKKSLPNNEGMLFKFEKAGYYSFWMKDMKFPIDIIFIKNNKIVTIYNDVKPPVNNKELAIYQPLEPADTILEINSGLAKKYGFKKDMQLNYENLGN